MKKYILFTILAVLLFFDGNAKHIVGGFMSYTFVSGTTHNIILTVYRDCSNPTNPGFDGEGGSAGAIVGVFDQNDNLVEQFSLVNPDTVTIGTLVNNQCLQTPVCVQQGTYNFQVTLPDADEGYTISYGRCCRNNTIINVLDPGNTGADYWAYIPPTNPYHNNSPVFNSFPPIFISLDSPLVYNNSATDLDSDVLRYSLCTPYTDGNANSPIPDPPDAPPYENIVWATGYSDANLLGGVPLAIDSITGVLTGTPNTIGQFVVGVCVSEIRNGQLIATYLRDFQFNVIPCNSSGINGITSAPAMDNGIHLFPNPASSLMTISAKSDMKHIRITNILGKELMVYVVKPPSAAMKLETFDVSLLSAGLYLVEITTVEGTTVQRFAISR